MFSVDISAYPDSVSILEGVDNDVRTPDKLIDGENSTTDGRHMWLAPILPGIVCIYFLNLFKNTKKRNSLANITCRYNKTMLCMGKDWAFGKIVFHEDKLVPHMYQYAA